MDENGTATPDFQVKLFSDEATKIASGETAEESTEEAAN